MADTGTGTASKRRFHVSPRVWIGLVIAVMALTFIFQNRDMSEINVLLFRVQAAQWVTLLGIFLVGLGTGWLIFRPRP